MKNFEEQKNRNRRIYWSVISLVALSCGGTALAQTIGRGMACADIDKRCQHGQFNERHASGQHHRHRQVGQGAKPDPARPGRDGLHHHAAQIQTQSQGDNAPFNEVILRSPGVAQDSAANGDLHVRGEHANLQYRINDVLLPEGITGFGLELDPRFVESMQLITGSLPAEYGFRTAGVVDIQTKSGAFENGGTAEMYGGSYDTSRPSFEYGGTQGKWNYFMDGSYDHNDLGIENPTASHERHPRQDGPIQGVSSMLVHY